MIGQNCEEWAFAWFEIVRDAHFFRSCDGNINHTGEIKV